MEPNKHCMPNADLKARITKLITESTQQYHDRYKRVMLHNNTGEQIDVSIGRNSVSVLATDAGHLNPGDVLAYARGRWMITGSGRVLRGFVFFPTKRI
jgi:hypothetical protein